ncbi:MAG: hypothetical protein FWH26_01330 [Oscillospiraceae bacterium]|nr:hypothetical protein [Oscillospiraceae bacterium]
MKRLLLITLAAACLLLPAAHAVSAAGPEPLTIIIKYGGEALAGINVAVCRVAGEREGSGGVMYEASQAFSGAGADFLNLTEEKNIALAAALNRYAAANHIERSAKLTDSEGKAVFAGLPDGLYLVAQMDAESSEYIIAPYLVVLPRDAVSLPKSEPVKREPPTTTAAPASSANEGGPDYALPGTGEPDADASKPGRFTLPKTDDLNNLALWLVIMGGSCAGFVTVVLLARKRKRREKNPA